MVVIEQIINLIKLWKQKFVIIVAESCHWIISTKRKTHPMVFRELARSATDTHPANPTPREKIENSTVDRVVSECGLYKVYAHPELASFSTRKLLEELKARGYTWEKMFAPRQEIDYRKI